MKCKECSAAIKDFFNCAPGKYVCIGVKEPFVIDNPEVECTEYKEEKHMPLARGVVSYEEHKFAEPFVDNEGIYVRSDVNPMLHKLVISKELFVEAYNKWIKGE